MNLTSIRLPIDWSAFGLPGAFIAGGVTVTSGPRGWAWDAPPPDLDVASVPARGGTTAPGFGLDHVVLLVPDLDVVVARCAAVDLHPRKLVIVRERPTGFFLVGTLLEVVEEPSVDRSLLWGLCLETTRDLGALADDWRARGHDVGEPHPAYQEGRSIVTVRDAGAGLAVMSARVRARTSAL
jgi:hypothetical protein